MGIRIGEISSRLHLVTPAETRAKHRPCGFLDEAEALRFLQAQLMAPETMAAVRAWASTQGLTHPQDRGLLQVLAAALQTGRLRVVEERHNRARLGKGISPQRPEPNVPPPPSAKPAPKPKPVAELLVTVVDLNGKPIEGATVTAGALGSRVSDAQGKADFGTVSPGSQDITATKPGHGKRRKGPEEPDEKKAVALPAGKRTEVTLIQQPECANVAFFEGATTRANYFGFDHKTNMVPAGRQTYWDPVPDKGSLSLPGSKLTRDGGRWVSVAVGKQTELEINFAFKGAECIPCIANSKFEILPASVAKVVTARITAKKASFKIEGLAAGEASLRVICDGNDLGWFHIWCRREAEILVDVATIVSPKTTAATYDLGALSDYMNDIFSQALIKLRLKDLGTIDLTDSILCKSAEWMLYNGDKLELLTRNATTVDWGLKLIDKAARLTLEERDSGPMPRAGARRLYFYVPPDADAGGVNISIGHLATFIFFTDLPAAYNTGAHEIGHSLMLRHPLHDGGAGQFPGHLLATLGQACPGHPATNTEAATGAGITGANVMAADPANLMGYWPDKAARKLLRYDQWKAASRS